MTRRPGAAGPSLSRNFVNRTPFMEHHHVPRRRADLGSTPAAAVLLLVVVGLLIAGCGGTAQATTGTAARPTFLPRLPHDRTGVALSAFDKAFYVQSGDKAYFRRTSAGRHANFWTDAEMIEMVEDAYQASPKPVYKRMVIALEKGVGANWGGKWTKRTWNDDIMWMTIASLRAYDITGEAKYLARAKQNFDGVYARAWDAKAGGGLVWITGSPYRNMTTNGPAAIVACMLYKDLHDNSYLAKAERIYHWMRSTLYDAKTGALADGVAGKTLDQSQLSYNYGVFIGAANLLYQTTHDQVYYADALRALAHVRATMTANDILKSEAHGANGNLGGLNGIFVRWAARFTSDNNLTSYAAWFRQNADEAWAHRNRRGLMGPDWTTAPRNGLAQSFDCTSGVVVVAAADALAR